MTVSPRFTRAVLPLRGPLAFRTALTFRSALSLRTALSLGAPLLCSSTAASALPLAQMSPQPPDPAAPRPEDGDEPQETELPAPDPAREDAPSGDLEGEEPSSGNLQSGDSGAQEPPAAARQSVDSGAQKPPTENPGGAQRTMTATSRRVVGDQATGFAKRTIGGLGLLSHTNTDGLHGGGGLHVRGAALLFGPTVSARYVENHYIGYGTAGTLYSLSAQTGIGLRYELPGNHGPFARVDVRGEITRAAGFYYSSLRLPGLQLGYGLDHNKWMLDVFGHAGPSLTGRVRTKEFTRPVEGAFVGGALSLGFDNWLLHSDVSHLLQFDGAFWDVRSSLCSYWGRKPTRLMNTREIAESVGPRSTDYSVGICTDFASLSFPRNGDFQQKTDFGLSIVFGAFSRLDRAGRP